ncbi:hypothetical protein [Rubrivirga litoralis]|uniref:Lipoprotein n=1 Tax=Rubrivirga litoralis TaxID=3075598 RepID=A0ABU3BQ42_9BACT|nr:hypothetical protein [Rubrivirga sp. F394]MDT0631410.1 hypothetical protein [Rubrivirga sp. F394]
MRGPLLTLALLLASCAARTPEGWTRYDLADGAYSLAVPPEAEREAVQGIDSQVDQFTLPGLRLDLDYGAHGGAPPEGGETERVGGRTVVVAREPGGVGAWFEVEPVDHGDGTVSPSPALTVHAVCETEAACETARRIVRTVRF